MGRIGDQFYYYGNSLFILVKNKDQQLFRMGWFLGILWKNLLWSKCKPAVWFFFFFVPRTGDQRVLSPLVRNKQIYLPVPSSLTELSGLELKQNTGSLSGFGETSVHTPTKSRSRQSSHSVSSHASGNSENFSVGFLFVLFNWVSYWKVMTCKIRCFWLSECMTE